MTRSYDNEARADRHLHAAHPKKARILTGPYSHLQLSCGLDLSFIDVLFLSTPLPSEKVESTVDLQLINSGHRLLGSPRTRQEAPVTEIATLEAPEKHVLNTEVPSPRAPPEGKQERMSHTLN